MTDDPSTVAQSSANIHNSTSNIVGSNSSKRRKTAAEYQGEYRIRKKMKRDRLSDDLAIAGPSTSTGESTTTDSSIVINRPITASTHAGTINRNRRKTAADYQRDYRSREKEKRKIAKGAALSTVNEFSANNIVGSNESKKRKTAAEYQGEYRIRKKMKRDRLLDDLTTASPSNSAGESNTADQSTVIMPPITASTHVGSINPNRRKKAARYQRDYRARRKEKRKFTKRAELSTVIESSANIDTSTNTIVGSNESKRRKTAAEYQGEYRIHKKMNRDRLLDDLAIA
ncbi:hypothetical protein PV328_011890, partial [Microctonus aethiopoides]